MSLKSVKMFLGYFQLSEKVEINAATVFYHHLAKYHLHRIVFQSLVRSSECPGAPDQLTERRTESRKIFFQSEIRMCELRHYGFFPSTKTNTISILSLPFGYRVRH